MKFSETIFKPTFPGENRQKFATKSPRHFEISLPKFQNQEPLNGGVSNGGVSRSGLVLPFLSFFGLFGTFPIFLGFSRFARGWSGDFPDSSLFSFSDY